MHIAQEIMNRPESEKKKRDRLLVRGVNWIGDAVMTIPALRALGRSLPDTELVLLLKPWVAPLFERDPDISEIISYAPEYNGLVGKIRLAARLRSYEFGTAVLFQNAFDAALITALAGIKRRIGYNRDGRGFLLTDAVDCGPEVRQVHEVDYYLGLVRKAGFQGAADRPWLFLGLEEREKARAMLSTLRRPLVALNPGATYGSSKRWPPARFAELAAWIISELGGSVLLLGGPAEASIGSEILQSLDRAMVSGSTVLNAAGRTTLRELMALIAESDSLVTNDSGPMHVGYGVGTPLVAIFGSTSPELTGPVGYADIVMGRRTDCSPCFERECRKGVLECMDLISVKEVCEAVQRQQKKRRAVFFDRDGTLCRDAHYLRKMEDLDIFPEAASLARLKEQGFLLIGVSNQSGIARGIVAEEFTKEVNRIFVERCGFDDFYYCPHHPEDHCSCRKPEPGMLVRARAEHGIDLRNSYVVGDKELDLLLAKAVGAKALLVTTGGVAHSPHADAVAAGLDEAVQIILADSRGGSRV